MRGSHKINYKGKCIGEVFEGGELWIKVQGEQYYKEQGIMEEKNNVYNICLGLGYNGIVEGI